MATIFDKLTAVANAIRTKTGSTGKLSLDKMASDLNSIPERTSSNLTASGATVTVPAGNYKSQATKSVATATRADTTISVTADDTNDKLTITAANNQSTGYVTGANKTATKTISLSASGATVTASDGTNKVSKSVTTATQATPTISILNGLITASATQTAGYVSAGTKSATMQLNVQAAATITPGTTAQTIAAGTYLTGVQTIAGDADLVAANIVSGKNIFGVAGSHTCDSNVLDFTVVGGTTQPTTTNENAIWVNTSWNVNSWDFSTSTPNKRSSNSNLICYPFYQTTRTENGITFTDNKDGTITMNGTATASAHFRLSIEGATNGEIILRPGTYTLSQGVNRNNWAFIMHYSYDNWKTTETQFNTAGGASSASITITKNARARFLIWVASGSTHSNVIIKPKFEKGSTATTFIKGTNYGQVWIKTSANSSAQFNALKNNNIQVYPIQAYQSNGSTWVTKTAKTYQYGAWTDLFTYLYNQGDACNSITGGYTELYYETGGTDTYSSSMSGSSIHLSVQNASQHSSVLGRTTANKVDLTNVNKIYIKGNCTYGKTGYNYYGLLVSSSQSVQFTNDGWHSGVVALTNQYATGDFTYSVDVTGLTGSYYIIPFARCYYNQATIVDFTQIWLE